MIKRMICVCLVLFSFSAHAKWSVLSNIDPISDVETLIGVSNNEQLAVSRGCFNFIFNFNGVREQADSFTFMLVRVDKNPVEALLSSWINSSMISVKWETLIENGIYDQMLKGNDIYFQISSSTYGKKTGTASLIGFTKASKKLGCNKQLMVNLIESRKKVAKVEKDYELLMKKQVKEAQTKAELDKLMDAEFDGGFAKIHSSKPLSEIARYKALIQQKINRNWHVESSMKGKTCTLTIRLASDGLVLSARRSKGDEKLCSSAKQATFKAKTLPIPRNSEISPQFRDFEIFLAK